MQQSSSRPVEPQQAVTLLVEAGLLDPARRAQALAVLGDGATAATPGPRRRVWVEVAGYVGAALVVGAIALVTAQTWDDLPFAAQVAVLVVTAVLLLGLAVVVRATGRDDVRRRLASTLTVGAAMAAAGATGSVVDRVDGAVSVWPGFAASGVLAVVAGLGYLLAPSALGHLTVLGGLLTCAIFLVTDLLDEALADVPAGLEGTACLGVVGGVWLAATASGVLRERDLGAFGAAALVGLAAQWPVLDGRDPVVGYVLSAVVAGLALVVHARVGHWTALVLGIGLLALAVPEALVDWTDGALGAAGIMLVSGLSLLGAAVLGLRLRRTGEPATPGD